MDIFDKPKPCELFRIEYEDSKKVKHLIELKRTMTEQQLKEATKAIPEQQDIYWMFDILKQLKEGRQFTQLVELVRIPKDDYYGNVGFIPRRPRTKKF